MKYIVITIKSPIEIIFSELEMTCCNCKYGHLETDGKWHCCGEKEAPEVSASYSCDSWRKDD